MLKINLLPTTKRDTAAPAVEGNKLFAVGLAVALMVTGAGIFLFHANKSDKVKVLRNANQGVEGEIATMRRRVANHPRVRAELAEITARQDAIEHLQAARTGPTRMLIEISHLLSPGGRPTQDPAVLERVRHDNPSMDMNPNWDTHRLWLRRFSEENRNVVMEGDGRTPEDVGEFMRRMMLSHYFENVRLDRSEGGVDAPTGITVQHFRIAAQVRY